MDLDYSIGDLIEVPPVRTVIKLSDGYAEPENILTSFVLTPEVEAHLFVLSHALKQKNGHGFFLQGDFGSGKSHFMAAFSAWLENRKGAELLSQRHQGLKELKSLNKSFLPVDISLVSYRSSTSLEQIIVTALEKKLAQIGIQERFTPLAHFLSHLESVLEDQSLAERFALALKIPPADIASFIKDHPRQAYVQGALFLKELGIASPETLVEDRYETFNRIVATFKKNRWDGFVLIIDELSEFFRSKSSANALNEDARTLQFLGELSSSVPIWIIAAVQESIESTGDLSQVTFQKIKDRFPTKLILSTLHIQALIRGRLVKQREGALEVIRRIHQRFSQQFSTFSTPLKQFLELYPVHPETIALLEGLGELFSVHRGIVDFIHAQLKGDPQRRIPGIMNRSCMELLAPDAIYDHFSLRLMEYSAYNIYPRHIVPHFDKLIRGLLHQDDWNLAKRLLQILILYHIHPTAEIPTVRKLAELTATDLDMRNQDVNVEYVSDTVLAPLAEKSSFLLRKPSGSSDPLAVIYEITLQEDYGKNLRDRIRKVKEELDDSDSRLLTLPLSQLKASDAWPGSLIFKDYQERLVSWRQTSRRALVCFLDKGQEETVISVIQRNLDALSCAFAVVLSAVPTDFSWEHTTVWVMRIQPEELEVLKEYLASHLVLEALSPSDPSQAALIEGAQEMVEKEKPYALQGALNAFYAGGYTEQSITVEPAIRQIKQFDRLMEEAGNYLLGRRFPRFSEIAPRKIYPSLKHYRTLLDEFIIPGTISLQEARKRGIVEAIEGLAAPLGFVRVKSGTFHFSSDAGQGLFISYFMGLLKASGPTPLQDLLYQLQSGEYGVPVEMADFLLAALANSGMISLLKRGRRLPLEYLTLATVKNADAVAPGEMISQAQREILQQQCGFLFTDKEEGPFGLKQQREVWKNLIQFKEKKEKLGKSLAKSLHRFGEYKAFRHLALKRAQSKLESLDKVLQEIKVSYSAVDGLERFLSAWNETALTAEDLRFLEEFEHFFTRYADQYIFIHHYIGHPALDMLMTDKKVKVLRANVLELIHDAGSSFVPQPEELNHAFREFWRIYVQEYSRLHHDYYAALKPAKLSKWALRAVKVLKQLSGIEALDRPRGLELLLARLETPKQEQCRRNLSEELYRSPLCSCGYKPGDLPPAREGNWDGAIEKVLNEYVRILKNAEIREAMTARLFAIKEVDKKAEELLRRLYDALQQESLAPFKLLDLADQETLAQLDKALSGRVEIKRRDLEELKNQLSGRRLSYAQVQRIMEQWLGEAGESAVFALDGTASNQGESVSFGWWLTLQKDSLQACLSGLKGRSGSEQEIEAMQRGLEAAFPWSKTRDYFAGAGVAEWVKFLGQEKYHLQLIRGVLNMLAQKLLEEPSLKMPGSLKSVYGVKDKAGELNRFIGDLQEILAGTTLPFPQRLRIRVAVESLLDNGFSDPHTRELLAARLKKTEELAYPWLEKLGERPPLGLEDKPVVIILDGVSADVLFTALEKNTGFGDLSLEWWRMPDPAFTPEALSHLFGLTEDALNFFAAQEIPYSQVRGDEEEGLMDLLGQPPADKPWIIRFSALDEDAHKGIIGLKDMVLLLSERLLPRIWDWRSQLTGAGRRVVLTTDHGFSVEKKRLVHGRGGVYERLVFQLEWQGRQG